MKTKKIIFDAGPLINFAMNGSLHILRRLKKEFKGEFLITKEVKEEIIDHPENIKRFELGALQLKALFNEGIIQHANITEVQIQELRKIRERLKNTANSTFKAKGKYLHLIDKGESAALALAEVINHPSIIVIDERTTRMLCENPENLRRLLQKKLHTRVISNENNYKHFKKFRIIRSTELAFIAYKKGLFELKDPKALEAMLYGLKYKGCSISEGEIEEMKRL
jgi:predicted nucleic acid-binding protein